MIQATIALPLDGLKITAPLPQLLTQLNVLETIGMPPRSFLDEIRRHDFPLPVIKRGKLRFVDREAFVAYLQASETRTLIARPAGNDCEDGVSAVLAEVGLQAAPREQGRRRRSSAGGR